MLAKVNVSRIVEDHIGTLKSYTTDKIKKRDIFLQFILPGILSLLILWFGFKIDKEIASPVITTLSIFCPLLLNLQILIYGILEKYSEKKQCGAVPVTDNGFDKFYQLLKETYYNISFGILASVIALLFFFVFFLSLNMPFNQTVIKLLMQYNLDYNILIKFFNWFQARTVLSFIGYYFLWLFLIDLFIVIKRVHILIDYQMNRGEKKKQAQTSDS